jgi:hypothetical protein
VPDEVERKELPWFIQLFFDVIMLKSTPLTAVVWGTFFILVIVHVAYACGFLTRFGLDAGFAKDDELKAITTEINQNLEKTRGDIAWLLKTQIHIGTATLCNSRDPIERADLANYVDQLENEYTAITQLSVPIVPCPATVQGSGVP